MTEYEVIQVKDHSFDLPAFSFMKNLIVPLQSCGNLRFDLLES